jgi:prepilin-type N-terminal cleavage/methylation domain-containing protein
MRRMKKAQRGFSLIELLIAMAVLAVMLAAIMIQVKTAHERGAYERTQVDLFQESREFMDQIARDLRQSGYPNPRNYDASFLGLTAFNADLTTTPPTAGDPKTSPYAAVGLTQVDATHLYFEGGIEPNDENPVAGINENSKVLFTQYYYDASTTGNCPCLVRSQQVKTASAPNTMAPDGTTEVQYVQNFVGGNNVPIFSFFTNGGTTPVPNPSYVYGGVTGGTSDNSTLANIDTVRIQLMVQSPYKDLKTGLNPVVTLVSTIRVTNCSQLDSGKHMSCAN